MAAQATQRPRNTSKETVFQHIATVASRLRIEISLDFGPVHARGKTQSVLLAQIEASTAFLAGRDTNRYELAVANLRAPQCEGEQGHGLRSDATDIVLLVGVIKQSGLSGGARRNPDDTSVLECHFPDGAHVVVVEPVLDAGKRINVALRQSLLQLFHRGWRQNRNQHDAHLEKYIGLGSQRLVPGKIYGEQRISVGEASQVNVNKTDNFAQRRMVEPHH